jgi:flagellar biosynthesis protein FlhF
MSKALELVKHALGEDALIVATRSFKKKSPLGVFGPNVVEITARKVTPNDETKRFAKGKAKGGRLAHLYGQKNSDNVEQPQSRQHQPSNERVRLDHSDRVKPNRVENSSHNNIKHEISDLKQMVSELVSEQRKAKHSEMPDQLFDTYLNLIQQEVADELAKELLADVQDALTGNELNNQNIVGRKLLDIVERTIETSGPISCNVNGTARTVALIGPTGVGKTTTIAKLAANFKLKQNKKVGLITMDTYRIGAVDQLRMYAQIIDVELKVVLTPDELQVAVDEFSDMDIIFIDTAGRSPQDDVKIKELQTFLDKINPDEVHLVLSTIGNQANMLRAAERFGVLGVERVIFTKLDEAISCGIVFSVLKKVGASLSYITTGQAVPDDIEVGNSRMLAQKLVMCQN